MKRPFGSFRWVLGLALAATLIAAYFAPATEAESLPLSERTRSASARSTAPTESRANRNPAASGQKVQVLAIRSRDAEGADADKEWFAAKPQPTAAPQRAAVAVPAASAPAEPPQAPSLPFRAFGRYVDGGEEVIFLQHKEQSLVVRVGDTIEQHYKVESLKGNVLTLRYLPLDQAQTLDLGSSPN